jgi:hypothetical protein
MTILLTHITVAALTSMSVHVPHSTLAGSGKLRITSSFALPLDDRCMLAQN